MPPQATRPPIRPTLATGLAVGLGLVAVAFVGAIVVGLPFCGWSGRIPRNVVHRVAAAFEAVGSTEASQRERGITVLAHYAARCPRLKEQAVPVLTTTLRDPSDAVRLAAIKGLGNLGAEATPAIPELEAAKGRSIPYVDYVIAESVWFIRIASPSHYEESGCEALTQRELAEARAVNYAAIPDPRW